MIHEFQIIINKYRQSLPLGYRFVLATLVHLEGSSYRKPGVSMLILENGETTGNISGGCVEKFVVDECKSVFKNKKSKIITYDGRYRLGCDGLLHILIETFSPDSFFLEAFDRMISNRENISFLSYYQLVENVQEGNWMSGMQYGDQYLAFDHHKVLALSEEENSKNLQLQRSFGSMMQLVIIGAEYDAVELTKQASFLGWQTILVCPSYDPSKAENFPGVFKLIHTDPETFPFEIIDENTAVVVMTHNYARDLNFLLHLQQLPAFYIGLLGPIKRRNQLLNDILEKSGDINSHFLDILHGPAGLDIGAETAEEIALSICSEILTIKRKKEAGKLKNCLKSIHS